jgi:hypothetical protein
MSLAVLELSNMNLGWFGEWEQKQHENGKYMEYNTHSYVELSCILLTLAVSCLCVINHMFNYSNCHIFFCRIKPSSPDQQEQGGGDESEWGCSR